MYSRNYATFENVNTSRLTTVNGRNQVTRNSSGIPFKSYSDESAFERFNNLGMSEETEEVVENNKGCDELKVDKNYEEERIHNIEAPGSDVDFSGTKISDENEDNFKRSPIFSEFHKLLKLMEGDWFIVVLAVSMLIFSSNETNDKLTPIALLAILLF